MDLATALVSIGSAVLASGGFAAVTRAVARHKAAPVDATVRLTDSAMVQVDQLQERVKDAEATTVRTQVRMHEVEQEAEDARQQMRAVRREAGDLAERLAMLARWIHEPAITLAELRARVPLPPGRNGTTS